MCVCVYGIWEAKSSSTGSSEGWLVLLRPKGGMGKCPPIPGNREVITGSNDLECCLQNGRGGWCRLRCRLTNLLYDVPRGSETP